MTNKTTRVKISTVKGKEIKKMTREEKINWIEQASNEELLKQYITFMNTNKYGCYDEDIDMVHDEIMKRMSK